LPPRLLTHLRRWEKLGIATQNEPARAGERCARS
jgi:hypothetical protein